MPAPSGSEEPQPPLPAHPVPSLPTPAHSIESDAAPADGFAEFMELGDASAAPEATSIPSPPAPTTLDEPTPEPAAPSSDQSPSPPSPPPNAVSFFTGLFARATTTLETTLQNAGRDLAAVTEALPANLSDTGATVTSFVSDRVRHATPPPRPSSLAALAASPPPTETAALKPVHAPGPALAHAATPPGILLATATALHFFAWDAARQRTARLNITWSPDGSHAVSTPPPPSLQRPRAHNPGRPVRATAAVYLPAGEELVAGHEDGALRVFSAAAETFGITVRAGAPDDAVPTVMAVAHGTPARVIVACQDGSVRIVESAGLRTLAVLQPPESCAAPFGAGFRYSPASCASIGESVYAGIGKGEDGGGARIPQSLCVGYEDGTVSQSDAEGEPFGVPFTAHARKVSSSCLFYDGVILLTIGNETDPSLAVFDAQTGRCLVRRMLPYVPTCLAQVPPAHSRTAPEEVCPSENAFIIGGDEGQCEIFRVVVLSPKRLEVRLVRRVSERLRGRDRCVLQISYLRNEAILMALSKNGELRRWRLSAIDSSSLALVRTDGGDRKPSFNEKNIVDAMSQDFTVEEETRLSSVGDVIQAQNVLAAILDEDSIPEPPKDQLVLEFQKKQAEMLAKISQADTELRRAKRRISARFADGLKPSPATSSFTEQRLARASKRTAAFEIEFATRRHAETLRDIQASTLDKLKILLLNCIKGARSADTDGVSQIRIDAERLGSEDLRVQ